MDCGRRGARIVAVAPHAVRHHLGRPWRGASVTTGGPPARAHAAAFLAVPVASAVGWFAFFRIVYGVFNPSVPYGGDTQTSAGNILTGLPALMFDHQFGIHPERAGVRVLRCRLVIAGAPAAASRDRADGAGGPRTCWRSPHFTCGGPDRARRADFSRRFCPCWPFPAHGSGRLTSHRSTRAVAAALRSS